MRTYFLLNKDREKIGIVPPKSIRWEISLYEPGSFTVEVPLSDLKNVDDVKYVYRDGGAQLGYIQKYEYTYTITDGKKVILSGCFMEGLLNNIPVVFKNPLRQLDSTAGVFIGEDSETVPTGISATLKSDNQVVFFQKGNKSDRVMKACYACAQLSMHEFEKYIKDYDLPINLFAFDEISNNIIVQDALDEIDRQDLEGDLPVVKTEEDSPGDTDDGTDDQGRTYFKISKGTEQYLGDVLYNWLNGCWITTVDDATLDVPPYHPVLRCGFNQEDGKVTLQITNKCRVLLSFELSEDKGNILSKKISQDISQEPAACISTAIYLYSEKGEDGTTIPDSVEYRFVKEKAISNKYSDLYNKSLDSTESGKLVLSCDYLGNTFEDYITQDECRVSVRNSIENFKNGQSTLTLTVEPLLDVDDYEERFTIGDMIKVDDKYLRLVGIDDSIDDGIESLSLTFESREKSAYKCFIDKIGSLTSDNKAKG